MNDDKNPAVIDTETAPAPQPAGVAQPTREAAAVWPLVLAVLALTAAIGLGVATYFIWFQIQQLAAEQTGIETGVSERLQPLRRSLDAVSERLSGNRQTLEARIETLDSDQQGIAHRLSVVAAQMGRSEDGWALAEVEYLLRIASQRLQLQGDTRTAAQALKAADSRLRELADPHYQSVRQQIALELDAIEAVPDVDVAGLSAALSAALEQVDRLPLAGSHYQPATAGANSAASEDDTAADAEQLGRLVWRSLSELFEVREHDRPVRPLLPPESEFFLRENLRLQLAAARLALLREDRSQYRAALRTADEWLNEYFDRQTPAVRQLSERLEEAAAVDIKPPLPDVAAALQLLRQQMQLARQQEVMPVVPETGAGETPSDQPAGDGGDAQ